MAVNNTYPPILQLLIPCLNIIPFSIPLCCFFLGEGEINDLRKLFRRAREHLDTCQLIT